MGQLLNACITGTVLMVGLADAMPVSSEQLAVGQTLVAAAEVKPEANADRQPMLRLTVERDASLAPLSLEVRLADPSGKPSNRSVPLTTLSFFGVEPGRTVTFEEPLPEGTLGRVKDGKLALELHLKSNARADVAALGKIEIKRAVVEPAVVPPAADIQ
jgi:hypothetical protein